MYLSIYTPHLHLEYHFGSMQHPRENRKLGLKIVLGRETEGETSVDKKLHPPVQTTTLEVSTMSGDIYEFWIEGQLQSDWSTWFDGMTVSNIKTDVTVISGRVIDQAALHGVIARFRDLNLKLILLVRK